VTRYEIELGKMSPRQKDLESFRAAMEMQWQGYKKMYIDTAYGKDLDDIGESIGIRRRQFDPMPFDTFPYPESDSDYRNRISTQLHDAHMNNILTK
jgi:hypothetical protein